MWKKGIFVFLAGFGSTIREKAVNVE